MFMRKFWVSLILTVPVVLLHWTPLSFSGSEYAPLVLGTAVFFYGGWVFLMGAWREIRGRMPGMMTLIAIAISAAYLWSVYAVFAGAEALFWELTTLITIMLLGHWIEMRAVSGAQGALKELSKLLPDTAEIIHNGNMRTIPLSELKENDLMLVRPGAKIPADGTVMEGESDINESMVTGESNPVSKKKGDPVIAGTINGDGSLTVRVSHIGKKTFLAGVMRLVAEAQASKSRLQVLSDRAALYLTVVAVGGGIITFIAWLAAGAEVGYAVARLVAVLVIACPHALGLAVPLVASISTTKAAQNGFLIKQRLALEAARGVDTVLFDKTGTLTQGSFAVTHATSDEVLVLAASVNAHSEHPIGKAILAEATKRNLRLREVRDFKRVPGRGAEGTIDGKTVFVGNRGGDDIVIMSDGKELGTIGIADTIRAESKQAIDSLRQLGITSAMITGDSEQTAKQVADELGLDTYFARVLPEEKVQKVHELQKGGKKVAMIGDGINDAPALTAADLGVAVGAGTNVAIESAGIILIKNDPRDIVKIIRLSKLTYAKMIQNLWWASGYNIIALPLAAGALAFKGIVLDPAVAAVLMSLSTIIVAFNAILLKRRKLV
ncbi:ATPase P [Candidatus Wolfebacteria bacterium RIFCSPHIGHO2_01_FULL_48_22]|uniref:ATPase P n=1 Tax=Candidatus Wolfebacteria bacterium RIFCSPHIGHO2_01_FULL_48_22 TaxID=1802555 RepID=A0A1F8DRB1_9BACT|nr:MAG: ATPase P [Candidatus Wolfebacteria bacterium RIFCSPHIGHO2_01_FULL_48_22]